MSFFKTLRLRLRSLFRREAVERELASELEFHVEWETTENVARGMTPAAAREAALLKFGSVPRYQDDCRDARRVQPIENLQQDFGYAFRTWRRNPGFTLIVVTTLALAIGANTTIFSIVNGTLLRPLPFPDSRELVALYSSNPDGSIPRFNVSYADLLDWQRETKMFSSIAAFRSSSMTLASDATPERLAGLVVTDNFFRMLGVVPATGRLLSADDVGSTSVVLSHAFWQQRFGGDPGIVGRTVQFGAGGREVIGVLPANFEIDGRPLDVVALLTPDMIPGAENHGQHMLEAAGRLKPGVTVEQGRADLAAVAARLATIHPDIAGWGSNVFRWEDELVRTSRNPLLILLAAAGMVLLIGCINVANLLVARGTSRSREIGLRHSLGASRWRLVSQLLVESVLLAVSGGALGVGVAMLGTQLILKAVPAGMIPRLTEIHLDLRILLFAFGLSAFTAIAIGLWPALRTTGMSLASALRDGGRATTGGRRTSRTRRILVVAEISLALVMVTCSALVVQSLQHILNVDPGFRSERVMTMRFGLPPGSYPDSSQIAFYRDFQARLEARPGIEAVAGANTAPIAGGGIVTGIRLMDRGAVDQKPVMNPVTAVTPGYFRTMKIPVLKGRDVAWTDGATTLVVSQAAAKTLWPGQDPLGKRIAFGARDTVGLEIVGVVGDAHARGLTNDSPPMIYMSMRGATNLVRTITLVVRATGEATSAVAATRSVLGEMDRTIPLYGMQTVDDIIDQSVALTRLNTLLLTIFAVLAMVLATIGIYGVVSYSVAQRQQEIGVRMALGAQRSEVVRLILREGAALAVGGVLIGSVGAVFATKTIRTWLFGIEPGDPLTLAIVATTLVGVALAASWLPARRAARVDPVGTMRGE